MVQAHGHPLLERTRVWLAVVLAIVATISIPWLMWHLFDGHNSGFSFRAIHIERPFFPSRYAEVHFAPAGNKLLQVVWITGEGDDVGATDYVPISSPVFLRPGTYSVMVYCPQLHSFSYQDRASLKVPSPGVYVMRCKSATEAELVPAQRIDA